MSDEALPCPNPECKHAKPVRFSYGGGKWSVHLRCDGCGYESPWVHAKGLEVMEIEESEAIRLHNLIARPSVSTAELGALAAEHEARAQLLLPGPDGDNVKRACALFAKQLRTLISKATNGKGNE